MATWMEPINPFLLKRKEKKSEFQFSKQTLLKKCLIIFFFFQTNFHACLGVESWFLKSVGDSRGQNNSHSWVKLWMHSDFAIYLHPHSSFFYVLLLPSAHQTVIGIAYRTPSEKRGGPQPWETETHSMTAFGGSGYQGQDHINYIGSKAKNQFVVLPLLGCELMNRSLKFLHQHRLPKKTEIVRKVGACDKWKVTEIRLAIGQLFVTIILSVFPAGNQVL